MARTHQGPPTVRFYQLATLSLEAALVGIVGKAWDRGLRLCLLAKDGEQAQRLDQLLWTTPLHPFLPHGLWNGADPVLQPILISLEPDTRNQATVLLLAAPCLVADPMSFDLLVDFVPGSAPAVLEASRARYRHYRNLGCNMEYWTQNPQGGWQQQERRPTAS
ncbi:MAG: DNA polymerase III subunit chi [Magnetococcales bacterium]|nr:DNA polymerase III subunit chi [Magnetococcales bacterium]